MNPDWVIVHDGSDGHGLRGECLRCGRVFRFEPPIEVDIFVAASKTFGKVHRHCKIERIPEAKE